MRETVSQYIHIQCDAYALLLNTEYIEEVVGGAVAAENCTSDTGLKTLEWRDLHLPIIDLSEILLAQYSKNSRDCLILSYTMESPSQQQSFIAVSVGEVANIEAIDEKDFANIPHLAFPYNDYFDKAYIHPDTQQCIYRLRGSALIKYLANDN